MKIHKIKNRTPKLLSELLKIWEDSVRATHLFLSDEEVSQIKEYVPQALSGVDHLIVAENEKGEPIAFMGFETYKRTKWDEEGNPYPLLYMKLME